MLQELLINLILLLIALFIPGYFLTLAFFTRKAEIDAIERITFSFVFSITFLPLLVLIENQVLGIPINFASVAGTFVLIIAAGLFGYLARVNVIPMPGILQKIFPQVAKQDAVPILPMPKK